MDSNEIKLNDFEHNPDNNFLNRGLKECYDELEKINQKVKIYEEYLKDKPLIYNGYSSIKIPRLMSDDLKKVKFFFNQNSNKFNKKTYSRNYIKQ
jgi:hypothetical protein